jgi:hypothetical protein
MTWAVALHIETAIEEPSTFGIPSEWCMFLRAEITVEP